MLQPLLDCMGDGAEDSAIECQFLASLEVLHRTSVRLLGCALLNRERGYEDFYYSMTGRRHLEARRRQFPPPSVAAAAMLPPMTWVLACFLLALTLGSCAAEGEDRNALQTRASGPPSRPDAGLEEEGKYDHSDHEGSRGQAGGMTETGSETLPQTMALRNPTSLHKRLYPRWYQAYVYKTPSFNRVATPIGGSKRFQPLHPLARFRGLAMGSSPGYSAGYHIPSDFPLSDQPGHPVPSAPNAQPSLPYEDDVDDEGLEAAEDDVDKIRAGDLLRFLKNIASDRGLSSHTKSFRYGISKRK